MKTFLVDHICAPHYRAMPRLLPLFLLCAFPVLGACSPSPEEDIAALEATRSAYFAGFESGDVAQMLPFYTEDSAITVPDGTRAGLTEIEAHYTRLLSGRTIRFDDFPEEVEAGPVYGFFTGTYRLTLTEGDTPPLQRAGRYMVILRRGDTPTGWAIHRELVRELPLEVIGN